MAADCSYLTNVTLQHTFTSSLTGRRVTIDQSITEFLTELDSTLSTSGHVKFLLNMERLIVFLEILFTKNIFCGE